jgi:hemoglobin/transferrin/lactoferrin receptor protein
MPRVKGQQWAVWAQDEVSWADGKYALTPALRFDSYKQTPQTASSYTSNPNAVVNEFSSSSGQRASPSLLAAYKPQDNLTLYARYGYGFKAPNAAQLYLNYGAPGTYLRAGSPTLKAEVSRGWELGVEAGNDDLGARLSFFENRYRDFIDDVAIAPGSPQWDPAWSVYPMGVTQSINRANVRIYGAELSAHAALTQQWYTWGSVAWSQGRDQATGQYLNSVAPLKAIVGLGYRADQWGAEGILTLAKRRSKVQHPQSTPGAANPDFQAPGYGVFDLTAYWKPQAAKGLRLQAGLYNVLDKKYWNALDVPTAGVSVIPNPINSYTQPGRSARLSLTYKY